jgi:adenylylsulfate kinase-like enzyme
VRAITAAISLYCDVRDEQRRNIEHFVEVYCKCSLETLERRDPKGLYERRKARSRPPASARRTKSR